MKHTLALALIIPSISFALPCPNGTHIIYKGDALEEVIKQCGEASSKNSYEKTVSVTQKWEYYKTNPASQANTKMTILFNHGRIANINILNNNTPGNQTCPAVPQAGMSMQTFNCSWEQNVASTGLCGTIIRAGDNENTVIAACGKPVLQQDLQTYTVQFTELKYDGATTQTLVFENGRLVDFK